MSKASNEMRTGSASSSSRVDGYRVAKRNGGQEGDGQGLKPAEPLPGRRCRRCHRIEILRRDGYCHHCGAIRDLPQAPESELKASDPGNTKPEESL